MEAHWRKMVRKQDADNKSVKWHLCPTCEALETGHTEAEVMEATFKKPMEHKKHRVQPYQEVLAKNSQKWEAKASKCGREINPWTTRTGFNLLRRRKKKLLRSNLEEMFPKRKAPAIVAKDLKAHNALVQKLNRQTLLLYRGTRCEVSCGVYPFGDPHGWLLPMTFIKIAAS